MKKPVRVWTYAPFSMWGSMSAFRPGRYRPQSAPEPLGLTIQRDPWWKRLWRWVTRRG